MPRIPFGPLRLEYRGTGPGGTSIDEETGREFSWSEGLKFEMPLPDGDVETVLLRVDKLDQAADFDPKSLKKGDEVMVEGVVSYGPGYASLKPLQVRRANGPSAVKAA